jgi:Putative sensor
MATLTPNLADPATDQQPNAPQRRTPWWRMPFSADTWRRTLYALLALPVGIVSVPVSILGGSPAAARLQRALAGRLLGTRLGQPGYRRVDARVVGHALLSLPLNAAAWVLTAYLWTLVVANLAYPLRPDSDDLSNAWGGPSLAGAWAVHGAAGLALLFVVPWVVHGLTAMQGRLARMLGTA